MELIKSSALQAGFGGGVVIDYPDSTKAKKYFLFLFVGTANAIDMPKGLQDGETSKRPNMIQFTAGGTIKNRKKGKVKAVKDRKWVQKKKETMRQKGYKVANDSKYTCRKRKARF
jgi:18S rRNA (guanine1575-N7)-methyltransferase